MKTINARFEIENLGDDDKPFVVVSANVTDALAVIAEMPFVDWIEEAVEGKKSEETEAGIRFLEYPSADCDAVELLLDDRPDYCWSKSIDRYELHIKNIPANLCGETELLLVFLCKMKSSIK